MPLVPIANLMRAARAGKYAVGYFESWNLESLRGVMDAAEVAESPVIIDFNGEFMSSPQRTTPERLEWLGALGRTAAEHATVPCGFIFNECSLDDWGRAVTAEFNLVMPAPVEGEPDLAYARRTRAIVDIAHEHGVAIEAELGALPFGTTRTCYALQRQ
jgi:fructose/tagatose bisphosphate aldolase